MNPENTGKTHSPSFFSRRKGCLIALLIPILIYGYLAFGPTGYDAERVKANRAAAEGVLEKRLVSRPQMDSPLEQARADTPISPEEAQFRAKEGLRLDVWGAHSVGDSRTEYSHPDLRDLDVAEIRKKLEAEIRDSKSKPESYESRNKIRMLEYLKTIAQRSPEENQARIRRQADYSIT
jgi:hypothetical protein